MSAAKHTAGPLETIGNLVRTDMGRGGFLVAEFRDESGQPHSDEAKANARLFVAAQDLLEALRDMLEVHGVRWEHARADSNIPSSWVELSDKARAAIAKATGGEQ